MIEKRRLNPNNFKFCAVKKNHRDLFFNIAVLNLWPNSSENSCMGVHFFSKFACNDLLRLATGAEAPYFVTFC